MGTWGALAGTLIRTDKAYRMTIDAKLFRTEEGQKLVKESEKRRFRGPETVDKIVELDKQWVTAQYNTEQKRKEIGKVQAGITEKKKTSKGTDKCEKELAEKTGLEEEEKALQAKA